MVHYLFTSNSDHCVKLLAWEESIHTANYVYIEINICIYVGGMPVLRCRDIIDKTESACGDSKIVLQRVITLEFAAATRLYSYDKL